LRISKSHTSPKNRRKSHKLKKKKKFFLENVIVSGLQLLMESKACPNGNRRSLLMEEDSKGRGQDK
jgi:hypothetical protein